METQQVVSSPTKEADAPWLSGPWYPSRSVAKASVHSSWAPSLLSELEVPSNEQTGTTQSNAGLLAFLDLRETGLEKVS